MGLHKELDAIQVKCTMPNGSPNSHTLGRLGHEQIDLNLGIYGQVGDGKKRHSNVADVDSQRFNRSRVGEYPYRSVEQMAFAPTPVASEIAFEEHERRV